MSVVMYPYKGECPVCGYGDVQLDSYRGFHSVLVSCPVCGRFIISDMLLRINTIKSHPNNYIVSATTRDAFVRDQPLIELDTHNIESYLSESLLPESLSDKIDKLLMYLNSQSQYAGDSVLIDMVTDYPVAFAKNNTEFRYLLDLVEERKLIEYHSTQPVVTMESEWSSEVRATLLPLGWDKIDEIKAKNPIEGNQCFVAMWFDGSVTDAYLKGIEPALRDAGYEPFRVDKSEHNEKICDRIIAGIRQSRIMVADFTGHRGGVYFEAGFAMGLGRPVIWLCHKDHIDKCHFDTRQYNHIVWENPEDLKEKLYHRIMATVPLKT